MSLTTPVRADVCIVGGGIIGLLTARELLLAGARVCIVDAHACGQESSWAGGGIVSPLYPWRYPDAITALARWAQAFYPTLCHELQAATVIDCEYQRSGLLLLAVNDRDDAVCWATRQQRKFQPCTTTEYLALQPAINADSDSALYFPDVAQVRNPRLMKALKADVLQRAAAVYEHTPITHFEQDGARTVAALSDRHRFEAERFVVCSGAWSAQVLRQFELTIAVKPIRGQMLMFAPHRHPLRHIVLSHGRYLIPRRDGRILCGSTVEDVGFDKTTTADAYQSLWRSALAILPSLATQTVERHWAGLRPGTRDGIPLIGRLPGHDNLYLNAGQFRNGVVLAPASARLLLDLMLQRPPIVDPTPYQLIPAPASAICNASPES